MPMTAPATVREETDPDAYPPLSRRYVASIVDGLVVLVGMIVVASLFEDAPPWLTPVRAALFVALWVGYEPVCTAFAATVGQRLFGFRVRRASDPERRIGLPAAMLRYATKLLFGVLSFMTMGFTHRQRALHDLVSGSVVLRGAGTVPAATAPPVDVAGAG